MPLFRYKAVNAGGEVVEGAWEAENAAAIVARLRTQGMIPIRVEPAQRLASQTQVGAPRGKALSQDQVVIFTQELASLVKAGIPLDRAFEILLSIAEHPALQAVLHDIQERIRSGSALAAALEAQHGVFSRFYLSMIRAGEAGGSLEVVLLRLAEHLQRAKVLRESVQSALVYPAILVVAAGISVTILLAVVVPQFQQLFADMGQSLPLATRIVIAVGGFIRDWGWLVALLITALVLWQRRQLQDPAHRLRWDAWLLRWPLLGELLRKLETARLTRALATLLANGVPMLSALTIAQGILSNQLLARALAGVTEAVKQGRSLHEPLREAGVFPKLAVQMIRVGEESGQLEQMLHQVADTYDLETQSAIKRMLTLLEPLLILGLAVLIAGIILSILVAILSLNEVVA